MREYLENIDYAQDLENNMSENYQLSFQMTAGITHSIVEFILKMIRNALKEISETSNKVNVVINREESCDIGQIKTVTGKL